PVRCALRVGGGAWGDGGDVGRCGGADGSVAAGVWSVVVGDVGGGGCAVSESVVLGRWFAGGAGSVGKSGRGGVVRAGGGAGSGWGDGSGGCGVAGAGSRLG